MPTPVYPAVYDLFQALISVEIDTGMVIDSLERAITWHAIDQLPRGFTYDTDQHDDPNSPALPEYIDPLGRLDSIVRIYSGMCKHFIESREKMEKSIETAKVAVQAAQALIDNIQLPIQDRPSAQIIYALGQLNAVLASRLSHGDDPRENTISTVEILKKQCWPITEWIERLRGTAKLTRPPRIIEVSAINVKDRTTPIKMVATAALHEFGVALEFLADAERDGTAKGVNWKAEMQHLHDVLAPHRERAFEELQVIGRKGKELARTADHLWTAVHEPCLPSLSPDLHKGLLAKRDAWIRMMDFILEPNVPATTPQVTNNREQPNGRTTGHRPAARETVVLWESAEQSERNIRIARTRTAYLECHGNVADARTALAKEGHPIAQSTFYDHLNVLDQQDPDWRDRMEFHRKRNSKKNQR